MAVSIQKTDLITKGSPPRSEQYGGTAVCHLCLSENTKIRTKLSSAYGNTVQTYIATPRLRLGIVEVYVHTNDWIYHVPEPHPTVV